MKYTKEDVKRKIDEAVERLRANPNCTLTEEELEERRQNLATDRGLAILAVILEILDDKKTRP